MKQKIKVGFARTSTKKQKLESQVSILIENGADIIFKEQCSGRADLEEREKWCECKEYIKKKINEGCDVVLLAYSINRISRDKEQGISDFFELLELGAEIEFILEPHLNSKIYGDKLKNAETISLGEGTLEDDTLGEGLRAYIRGLAKRQIELAFEQAQKEAEHIVAKVKQGLAKTTRRGGRRAGYKSKLKKEVPKDFKKNLNTGISKTNLAKVYGVGRSTIYAWINEIKINEEREPLLRYIRASLKGEELKKALRALDLATSEACIEELVNKYGITRELF